MKLFTHTMKNVFYLFKEIPKTLESKMPQRLALESLSFKDGSLLKSLISENEQITLLNDPFDIFTPLINCFYHPIKYQLLVLVSQPF